MEKITLPERPDWRDTAREVGFTYADEAGAPYWDEASAYCFSLREVETAIEAPATELHAMCRDAVARVIESEELLEKLAIPAAHRDLVATSWRQDHPEIYGRFDLMYDGDGPAKLLEYNADTPTSLYESSAFQWQWLEDQMAAGVLPPEADQFNGIHEAIVERFRTMFNPGSDIHFAAISDAPEDYATVEGLAWAAREAGLGAHYTDLQAIGISDAGQFLDGDDRVIGTLFKLYPWEDLLRDDYARHLSGSNCLFLEPAWKAILSNKGILPVLWQMFEGHPNLLPAWFEGDPAADFSGGFVRKPLFSREGASLEIVEGGVVSERSTNTEYDGFPRIVQALAPAPVFGGFHPVIGAWIVGAECAGMGIREDSSRITQDLSRFKPHYIIA